MNDVLGTLFEGTEEYSNTRRRPRPDASYDAALRPAKVDLLVTCNIRVKYVLGFTR